MPFRKSSGADAEAAESAEEGHELVRIGESALDRLPFGRSRWRIAAQREEIADAAGASFLRHLAKLRDGGVDAGQVHHRGDAVLALNPIDDAEGLVARAP